MTAKRERKRLLLNGSLPKFTISRVLAEEKLESGNLNLDTHVGGRDPEIRAIPCCFPLAAAGSWNGS